jgi:tRNA (guanine10-N2)-methyltransferase
MRGLGGEKSVRGNFAQYGLLDNLVGMFSADLTNTPVRVPNARRLFDAIVCDPPYGVREGLKVLGCKESAKAAEIIEIGLKKYRCVYMASLSRSA